MQDLTCRTKTANCILNRCPNCYYMSACYFEL